LVEAGVSVAIACIAAAAAMTNRVHGRINHLDNRVDHIELSMVKDFVSKDEHVLAMSELKEQMIRIEGKLDTFIQNYPKR